MQQGSSLHLNTDMRVHEDDNEGNSRIMEVAGTSSRSASMASKTLLYEGTEDKNLQKQHARPPWASLFRGNRKEGACIKLTKMDTNPKGPVFVEEDFVEEKEWELCLIGCVGGSFQGLGLLKQATRG